MRSVTVSHRTRVGGVKVRWLRNREEGLRNYQLGCLSVASKMNSCPDEGVVNVLAGLGRCGVVHQLSLRYICASQPFAALTLWN